MASEDLVKEVRELLACNPPTDAVEIQHALFADAIERQTSSPFWSRSKVIALCYARAPELLSSLCDEVERLRARLNDPCLVAGYHVCGGAHNLSDLTR